MKKILSKLVSVLPYLVVFVAALSLPSDPDLGWHLKYGEYFFQHGQVLRDNTFATLMPDFHWANVSWGTDLFSYLAFFAGGFLGLTILGGLVVTATFYFFSKASRLTLWDQAFLFPLVIFLEKPLNTISFRGQQISMLFLGILFYLISLSESKPKMLYLVIPLFLVWVNLHGQFFLGLVMFGVWVGLVMIQKFFFDYHKNFKHTWSATKHLLLIFVLSCLVTFVNPFGFGVHKDALDHIGNPLMKSVAEYLPFAAFSQSWWNQIVVATLMIIGMIFLFFQGKLAKQIPTIGSILLLYLLSFHVRRYAWPAYYLIFPLLKPLSEMFKPDGKKMTTIFSTVLLTTTLFVVIAGQYPFTQFVTYNWDTYCKSPYIQCSPKSAEFLVKNKLTNDLFSMYNWGGFLIWNYPEIRSTIDGRMHIWKDEKGYSGFEDYYGYEQNMKDIDKSSYNVAYMSPSKPVYDRLLELVDEGKWELVYEDEYAGVFVRK